MRTALRPRSRPRSGLGNPESDGPSGIHLDIAPVEAPRPASTRPWPGPGARPRCLSLREAITAELPPLDQLERDLAGAVASIMIALGFPAPSGTTPVRPFGSPIDVLEAAQSIAPIPSAE